MPPIKINSESNVVMRHGECPPVCRCALCLARLAVHPCTAVVPAVSGLSLSITYDFRRLEWQFSDPLSTHQNKVRHVTKESQGMDLAWGISAKFEGLSDCVCFWHIADIDALRMSAFGGKADIPYTLANVCL